jgi:subtilisin family serine protease
MKNAAILCLMLLAMTRSYAGYLEDQVDYAENRFIVKLQPETGGLDPQLIDGTVQVSDPALTALNRKWNVSLVERLFVGPENDPIAKQFDLAGYWRIWVSTPLSRSSLELALADYAVATIVEHVEPVGRARLDYTPNDPGWNVQQWYLQNTGADHDIDAVEAWDMERGDSTAILGITDTGVLRTHPDLLAHIWRNWAEKNGTPGVDDDGNGFVDDSTGWDFVTGITGCWAGEDCSTADNNPTDFNGHGTHVSGIAAGITNNSIGIAGIAGGGGTEQGARIMALRIGYTWGDGGGYVEMDFAAQAFNYGRIKGAHAYNCSWGNNNSGGLGAATDAAVTAGIVICVAAGNANNSTASYLAGRTDCIAVAATDEGDVKASFSSYGSWVDVSAPGVNIYSTYSNEGTATYAYLDGTSMATPCVTGEVGLIKSRVPSWTRPQIMDACTSTVNCDNIYDENPSWVGLLGHGRINLNLALLSTASITVTSPNGGEAWNEGSSQTITWTSSNVTGNVNIELNRSYPGGTWEAIAMNTTNDGTEPWNPVTLPASTTARIRVTSVSNGTISDVSDANFSIIARTITVTSPNGGETWIVGDANNITWTSTGLSENVRIEINRTYPSASWTDIIASTPNDGVHPWTVTSPTGTTTRIRISGAVTTTVKDTSDGNFTIGVRTITVTIPNGGETWPVGSLQNVTWTSQNLTGTVNIQLNRTYPGATWENIALGTADDGNEPWTVTVPATNSARMRVVSVTYPTVGDSSNANFTITTPNSPPSIAHDPLDDQAVQPFIVTALVTDDAGGFVTRMFYRLQGGVNYDSLLLTATGNPNEYSASVNGLAAGNWEYYLRVRDIGNLTAQTPPAPFTVGSSCGSEFAYDDGTAESSQWSATNIDYRWAVKFDPPSTPFVLCSGRIGISAIHPDATHSELLVEVFAADGLGGTPGTLLYSKTIGSIGNVIGGVPTNPDNWATVLFRDGSGNPLSLNGSYFIAVSNPNTGVYEAFLRDTSAYQGHSYVFVPCANLWYNENSGNPSSRLGNRLIRASGFGLTAPQIVVRRVGDNIQLDWPSTGAPYYRIYTDTVPNGAFTTLLGSTSTNTFTDVNPLATAIKFYVVKASTTL